MKGRQQEMEEKAKASWESEDYMGKLHELKIGVIILAAGLSQRMKSFKPLLPLGSQSALAKVVSTFRAAGISHIHVVLGHNAHKLIPVCAALEVKYSYNENYPQGMLTSVKAGVKALEQEIEAFFLLPVDIPIIQPATLQKLYQAFLLNQKGIIYPVYGGKRGHPPLISSKYKEGIVSWEGEGGLRAFLQQYPADSLEVMVEDPGIHMDMDTPEGYRRLLNYCGYPSLPTPEECYELLAKQNTPSWVIKHCERVAQVGLILGKELIDVGFNLNLGLINVSALLHDIARLQPNHPQAGARLTADYPEVAEIIAAHMDCQWDRLQPLTEKEIVYLADKLVEEENVVSLQERLEKALEKYQDKPEALKHIYRRYYQAYLICFYLEEVIGKSIYEIINLKLGRDVHG